MSQISHQRWREVYALAQHENEPASLREICAQARRLIHDQQIHLATSNCIPNGEIRDLEAALRHLWLIEEQNRGRRVSPRKVEK